jgi:hypothetical protein
MSLYETVILGSMKEEIIKNKGSNIALNLKQIQTKIEIPLASGAGYIRIGGEKKNMRGPVCLAGQTCQTWASSRNNYE